MITLAQFNELVGDTILCCQRIEHDIKIIYAGMLKGDFKTNLSLVSKETLGTVLVALNALDNSDNHPVLSNKDYNYLKEIKNIRNYVAHSCYLDFLYADKDEYASTMEKIYSQIYMYNENLHSLGDIVEDVRFKVLKKYGRL